MKRILISCAVLLSAMTVMASGTTVGNGGEVVVCRDAVKKIISIELLDVYEGRVLQGLKLNLGPQNLDVRGKIKFALNRISKVNPTRANRYSQWAESFFQLMDKTNETLPTTTDINPISYPAGCAIEQVAIQQPDQDPKKLVVKVNQPLWNSMNADDQAALVLHEAIYLELVLKARADNYRKVDDALPVRYFNQKLVSGEIEKLSFKQYLELVRTIGDDIDMNGLNVYVPEQDTDDLLVAANEQDLKIGSLIFNLKKSARIRFYPSGAVSCISGWKNYWQTQPGFEKPVQITTEKLGSFFVRSAVCFDRNGRFASGTLAQDTAFQITLPTGASWSMPCPENSSVLASTLGTLYSCELKVGAILDTPFAQLTVIKDGEVVLNGGMIAYGRTQAEFKGRLLVSGNWLNFDRVVREDDGWYRSGAGYLSKPSKIKVKGNEFSIMGGITFYPTATDAVFRAVMPAQDFVIRSRGQSLPVSAVKDCPREKHYNMIVFDSEEEVISFVSSKAVKLPGANGVEKFSAGHLINTQGWDTQKRYFWDRGDACNTWGY